MFRMLHPFKHQPCACVETVYIFVCVYIYIFSKSPLEIVLIKKNETTRKNKILNFVCRFVSIERRKLEK